SKTCRTSNSFAVAPAKRRTQPIAASRRLRSRKTGRADRWRRSCRVFIRNPVKGHLRGYRSDYGRFARRSRVKNSVHVVCQLDSQLNVFQNASASGVRQSESGSVEDESAEIKASILLNECLHHGFLLDVER